MKDHATTFAIRGAIGPDAARMIASAVRGIDPRASVAVSLSPGLARVQSSAPVEQIQQVIGTQGFITQMSPQALSSRQPRAGSTRVQVLLAVVARALLFGLLCAFVVPVLTFVVVLGVQHFGAACRATGDPSGCAVGLVSATILLIAPGAVLGFLIALGHGIVRLGTSATR